MSVVKDGDLEIRQITRYEIVWHEFGDNCENRRKSDHDFFAR